MTRPVGSIFFSEKNGRNYIVTQDEQGREKLTALARFNWENAYGPIPAGMELDHKDGNKLNDNIDNLQLLTPLQNLNKSLRERGYGPKHIEITCKFCGKKSMKRSKEVNKSIRRGCDGPFCDASCSQKYRHRKVSLIDVDKKKCRFEDVFGDVLKENLEIIS